MKKSKAVLAAVTMALMLFGAGETKAANTWKMEPLSSQVPIIQKAQELQETDRREFLCLALAVYHESKGQPEIGMRAVAYVILNRKSDRRFPSTICGVVWQPGQFSWAVRPVMSLLPKESRNWITAQEIAMAALTGESNDPTSGAKFFYNTKTDRPGWSGRGTRTLTIGPHVFLKF